MILLATVMGLLPMAQELLKGPNYMRRSQSSLHRTGRLCSMDDLSGARGICFRLWVQVMHDKCC